MNLAQQTGKVLGRCLCGVSPSLAETGNSGSLLWGCPATVAMSARGAVVLVYLAGPISDADSPLYRTSRNRRAPLNTTTHIPPSLQHLLTRLTYALSPSPIIGVRISVLRGLWSTFSKVLSQSPRYPNLSASHRCSQLRYTAFFSFFFVCLRLRSQLSPKVCAAVDSDYFLPQRLCACSNRQQ
jgi:hypothetical protein